MTIRCQVLPLDQFDRIAANWDELAVRYQRAPFMHSDFVRVLIAHFAAGSERIVRVTSNDALIAVGLFRQRMGIWETFQPMQSPIGCIVIREGVVLPDLLEAISDALPGPRLGAAATQQDPVYCPRPTESRQTVSLDYIVTASIEIAGSFDDYWSARGKNLQQNMRKQRRKLANEGIATTLDVITAPADVLAGMAAYAALESAGWKAGGGTAIGIDNSQGRFYVDLLSAFCARGRGKICLYRFGGKVVVVDLCIESDDTVVFLKTTYDESIRGYSPAALMRQELFHQFWKEGRLRHIEFYGRVMEGQLRWTEQLRTIYHVNWYRWPRLMSVVSALAKRLRPHPDPHQASPR